MPDLNNKQVIAQPKSHLLALDGMRGIAAVIVVLHHLGGLLALPWLAPRGYLGVDFFFMLSGLVLAYAYWDRISNGMSARTFILFRVIRLYPMIVFGVTVGLIIYFYIFRTREHSVHDLVLATLFGYAGLPFVIPSSLPPEIYPLDGPLWSIFFELMANGILFILIFRGRAALLSSIVVTLGGMSLLILARVNHELSVGSRLIDWPWGFARVAFSFFLGVLLFRWRTYLPRLSSRLSIIAIVVTLLFVRFLSHNVLFDLFVVAIVFPIAISSLSWFQPSSRLVWWCKFSGDVSYPLYAIHYPFVLAIGSTPWVTNLPWQSRFVFSIATMITLVGGAWIILKSYDQPIRRMLTQRMRIAK